MFKMTMVLVGLVMVSLVTVSVANAGSMAVNFSGTQGSNWTVSGTVGAPGYAQAYWTNTASDWTGQSSWGVQYNLVDNTGAATGATMDWYASELGSWAYGAPANDNERMMDAGIGSANALVEVHAVNIPYATYDVVVYFSAELTNAFGVKYTVAPDKNVGGSTSVYAQIAAMGYFAHTNVFTQVPSTSTTDLQGNTPVGNYIVFKNLTSSTLYLTAQSTGWAGQNIYTYADGYQRSCISGFQIVETPEPATLVILGIGGLLGILKRNRR